MQPISHAELTRLHPTGEHPERHLHGYGGILQADAYAGFNRLYEGGRKPGPLIEAACWSHSRRKLADVTARARGKPSVIAPLAREAVKRIDVGCGTDN